MNKTRVVAALAALSMPVLVLASEALAEQKQCMGCHALSKDGAGPAFQKIARHWKGRQDAERTLVATIRTGSDSVGGPHWNKARMPDDAERPQVSEAEARQLVKWILAR